MAHNLARKELEKSINDALSTESDFTYETNFNSTPLYWPNKFKSSGYKLRLMFFCLNSLEEAKRRVQIRVENGGHFVPFEEIEKRYYLGFKHLNNHWQYFNEIYLFETSTYNEKPRFILSVYNQKIDELLDFPSYLTPLIPTINILSQSL
jgi:predicted ABC-type ATPase